MKHLFKFFVFMVGIGHLIPVGEAAAQSSIITFTGKNIFTQTAVVADSIRIINHDKNWDTLLIGTNQYDLGAPTPVILPSDVNVMFSLGPNYPNAFSDHTAFDIFMSQQAEVTLSVYSAYGQLVASFHQALPEGAHRFFLHSGDLPAGVYFVRAVSDGESRTIKVLKLQAGYGADRGITYGGSKTWTSLRKSATDIYSFTGYADGFSEKTLSNVSPQGGMNYEFDFTPKEVISIEPPTLQGSVEVPYAWNAVIQAPPLQARYEWDFGDGATSIQKNQKTIQHTYTQSGSFTITLRLFNDRTNTLISAATAGAVISGSTSQVSISPGSMIGVLNTDYTWIAIVTNPPSQIRYEWDFGDGKKETRVDINTIMHSYSIEGIYTISLSVFNHTSGSKLGDATALVEITGKKEIRFEAPVEVLRATAPASGGRLMVIQTNTPVTGLSVTVPQWSYKDSREFVVSYSNITGHSMGPDFDPISPLISISNGGGYADSAMFLHIPISLSAGHFAMAFYYDTQKGELEGLPVISLTEKEIVVATRHLSPQAFQFGKTMGGTQQNFAHLIVAQVAKGKLSGKIMSDFRPSIDDWEFINKGSYISPKGNCAGQSLSAMWYFTAQKKGKGAQPLYGRFDAVQTDSMWMDNPKGYRLCSVVQNDMDWDNKSVPWSHIFDSLGTGIYSKDSLHFLSFAYAIQQTQKPQLIYISREGGAHAMVMYGVDTSKLIISDPNYPGKERLTKFENGVFEPYSSGANAEDLGHLYPNIRYFAKTALVSFEQIAQRWIEFERGVIGTNPPKPFPETKVYVLDEQERKELPSLILTSVDSVVLAVECPTCAKTYPDLYTPVHLTDENGSFLSFGEKANVKLKPGLQRFGLTTYGWHDVNSNKNKYIDFNWITVQYNPPATVSLHVGIEGEFCEKAKIELLQIVLSGSWNGDVFSGKKELFDDYGKWIGLATLTATVDTVFNTILDFSYMLDDFEIPGNPTLTFSGQKLPLVESAPEYLKYNATGLELCNYLTSVTGRWLFCGTILRHGCDPDKYNTNVHMTITLPRR